MRQKKALEYRRQRPQVAHSSCDCKLLTEWLGGRYMDVAQSVRVNAGVERSQVAENESAIRNVVEHCIRNVAVLNPQAARKNCNFVGQYIGVAPISYA